MDRPDDISLPSGTPWLGDPKAQAVCSAIAAGGHQVLFVGGCVRNALLSEPASDVDLSTDALPDRVVTLAERAGLKAIPTGIDHGTVTVVAGDTAFEVTTFRCDVETDGRRAVVRFSDDIHQDAKRRDFTINALYATPAGQVVDPLNGLPDLHARRVRFIEDATQRIKEDYLRILRFFRFSAFYADPELGFDPETISAISETSVGLQSISAERIGQEMTKLLSATNPAAAVATMRSCGVLAAVLPGADDQFLAPFVHVETGLGLAPDWRARLAILGGNDVVDHLRLSREDARHLALLRAEGFVGAPLREVAYRHGLDVASQVLAMRSAVASQPPVPATIEMLREGASARFPVTAADLMPGFEGAALGSKLKELEAAWIASDFKMNRSELLALS